MLRRLCSTLLALALYASAAQAETNDGLVLPKGFQADVAYEGGGPARHLAVRSNGDIYVTTQLPPFSTYEPDAIRGILALRDTNKDGRIDSVESFTKILGTGIRFYDNALYVSDHLGIYRFRFKGNELVPSSEPEVIVDGFTAEAQHADKTFAFDQRGRMYVNVGAPSNSCQEEDRVPNSPGQQPCPMRENYAGVWEFDARRVGQKPSDGIRYATGIRNALAIDWSRAANALFVVLHGRDQLDTLWPQFFTAEDNAEAAAEEMHLIRKGGDYGWPYTYFDARRGMRMLSPEYGGDGQTPAPPGNYVDPVVAFPAHWAPGDLLFYQGAAFPAKYRGGAFIAFHGSWNRAPLPQSGYNITFVPFRKQKLNGQWHKFIDNFTLGEIEDNHPANARYRPIGLATDKSGALYVMDSRHGRIWCVTYRALARRRTLAQYPRSAQQSAMAESS
jgi:glucose/arabinose dehydrogenase